jgi:hypothetical protein
MGLASRDRARRTTRAAVVLAALAVALAAAPSAQGASEFYGIAQSRTVSGQDLAGMAAANLHSDRMPLHWDLVQPTKSAYRWRDTDQLVGGLAKRGIRSVPFFWGSPAWAGTGGVKRPPVSASSLAAWKTFLKAAVARYRPGGTYWGTPYHQQFGAGAKPLPITAWQIWNEVNLKFAYPGSTYKQKATKYGALVKASREAIKSKDSKAKVVLAGIATQKDPDAFKFLDALYSVSGIKGSFDAAAVHPYASTNAKIKAAIQGVRSVMAKRNDKAKPLWITEFGWGSGPPDSIGINKGLDGQKQALTSSYKMMLANRTAWKLQRLFWFLWRDPPAGSDLAGGCSFCGSAGLVRSNGTAKPALGAFKAFTENPPPAG